MKNAIIVICSIILAGCVFLGGYSVYNSYHGYDVPDVQTAPTDKTSNINVMLKRAKNWHKIVQKALVDEKQINMIDGSTATIPITAELLRQFYSYNDDQIAYESDVARHSTTHTAYKNLIKRNTKDWCDYKNGEYLSTRIDLIFVTPPSEDEKRLAKDNDVKLDMTPIAKDGFVFITHKDNPVDSLTIEQVQKIYSGEVTNWKEVGGADEKIISYQREANSGSQTAMEQMVMQGKQMLPPVETKEIVGMGRLIDAVAEYQNGPTSIGYTYYYYLNNLYKNDNIKVLKINGISPENKNLLNESYPFTASYYAVIRGDESADSPARTLRDWLLTEEGQSVIELAGYCRSVEKHG